MIRGLLTLIAVVFVVPAWAQTKNYEYANINALDSSGNNPAVKAIPGGGGPCLIAYSGNKCVVIDNHRTGSGWPAANLLADGTDPLQSCINAAACSGTLYWGQTTYCYAAPLADGTPVAHKFQNMYCQSNLNARPVWKTKCYMGDQPGLTLDPVWNCSP